MYIHTHSYMFSLELALHCLQGSSSPDHSAEHPWQEGVCSWPPESPAAAVSLVPWKCQGRAHNRHKLRWEPILDSLMFLPNVGFYRWYLLDATLQGHSAAPCVGLAELLRVGVCPTAACWKWDISTPANNHVGKCTVLDRNTNGVQMPSGSDASSDQALTIALNI